MINYGVVVLSNREAVVETLVVLKLLHNKFKGKRKLWTRAESKALEYLRDQGIESVAIESWLSDGLLAL